MSCPNVCIGHPFGSEAMDSCLKIAGMTLQKNVLIILKMELISYINKKENDGYFNSQCFYFHKQ